ncbi:MAG: GAF domain-containing protein [Anaerolineales bacterium]|jgi:signal transduction histidine kinase|nr:GAF domain-containing protein [Anaerolineales bacterium]MCC6987268.1 GAF domain-containing protein [Anaerolineales bacterium]
MSDFIQLVLNQLTVPPGDLIYYIVLVFVIASALQSAFNHWRASEFPQAKRAFIGLGVLLFAQIFMFIFSGLGWQELVDPKSILPPMDRGFLAFAIIWITWLYAFPEPNRSGDAVATLLSMFIFTALGLSLISWNQQIANPEAAVLSYNLTLDDLFWQIGSLIFAALGMAVIFIRKPDGMWYGILLLLIGFLGHLGQLLIGLEGDFPGIVRLAYMAAMPILLTLPQRFSAVNIVEPPLPVKPTILKSDTQGRPERRRYSTDPKTFHALLAVAAENNSTKMSQAITRATAQTMLADLCFMIYLTDENKQMVIAGGYDLIREDSLEGGPVSKGSIPMLANSIQRGRPLRLPASSTSADIKGLADILGLSNPGHLLYVPILTPDKETLGGVLLLSPYSDRTWSAEDQAFLANIANSLVPIIQRTQKVTKLEEEHGIAKVHAADLEKRIRELTSQIESARGESEEARPAELASLRHAQEESQGIIEQLQKENAELRSGRNLPSAQLEGDLKATLREMAHLQNELAHANKTILELEKGHASTKNSEQAEVIASISQELRQPLSSIVGYTDLLLGESVGILGALQRKFVDRIKVSTERIRSLTDDMIQITTLATDLNELKPESVDLNTIIDNAMSYTSAQLREKNISINLEVPKSVSSIHADREALQQILIHLLQNAGAATPYEGTVRLKVQTRSEERSEFILIQVTDQGGGIASEDLPRVFTRLYRADNVLIQGVGDTGVGLSIAKTLTEAQHGRIWVESVPGAGATFSVLLPISGDIQKRN